MLEHHLEEGVGEVVIRVRVEQRSRSLAHSCVQVAAAVLLAFSSPLELQVWRFSAAA
jgi:hypothetical protein